MKRLFRQPDFGPSGYSALMVFAVAYAVVAALVVAPDQVKTALDTGFTLTR